MIGDAAIVAAEGYAARLEQIVARLRRLHGFSESEAINFIERFGASVDSAGDSHGTQEETINEH